MLLVEAVKAASTDDVVYFLLTAYVETLHHYSETRAALPFLVTKLPLTGKSDVQARLRALHGALDAREGAASHVRPVMEETIEILAAALRRFEVLTAEAYRANASAFRRAQPAWESDLPMLGPRSGRGVPLDAAALFQSSARVRGGTAGCGVSAFLVSD